MKAVICVVALGLVGLAAAGTKQHAEVSDPSGNWATARQGGYGGGWVRTILKVRLPVK